MANKNYNENNVINSLRRKGTININIVDKVIKIVRNANNIGNGSWGKIDYLRNVHKYIVTFVNGSVKQDYSERVNTKVAKRENKLNMVAMTKNAMRKAKTK